MTDRVLIVNEKDLVGKRKAEKEPYEFVKYEVTPRSDFKQCHVAVYEIPPRKANYPYHFHAANTEAFYILKGYGILRTMDGEKEIKEGDFIICPPAEGGAHKIMNTSDTELLRYIDFDTINSPDIVHYPDSNKTGVIIHNESATFFQNKDKAEYYDGE